MRIAYRNRVTLSRRICRFVLRTPSLRDDASKASRATFGERLLAAPEGLRAAHHQKRR